MIGERLFLLLWLNDREAQGIEPHRRRCGRFRAKAERREMPKPEDDGERQAADERPSQQDIVRLPGKMSCLVVVVVGRAGGFGHHGSPVQVARNGAKQIGRENLEWPMLFCRRARALMNIGSRAGDCMCPSSHESKIFLYRMSFISALMILGALQIRIYAIWYNTLFQKLKLS
jgi:hypothetical protein